MKKGAIYRRKIESTISRAKRDKSIFFIIAMISHIHVSLEKLNIDKKKKMF